MYKHFATDQNWQDETTIYWFENEAGDQYGISDCNGNRTVVDCDGYPVNTDDNANVHLLQELVITPEMVAQG